MLSNKVCQLACRLFVSEEAEHHQRHRLQFHLQVECTSQAVKFRRGVVQLRCARCWALPDLGKPTVTAIQRLPQHPLLTLPAHFLRSREKTGQVSCVCLGVMLMRWVRSAEVPCAYAHLRQRHAGHVPSAEATAAGL